jgi:hypothetical protein
MLVTIAYVLVPKVNTSTSPGALSMSNPFAPSTSASIATMAVGLLTSIIWMPSSGPLVMTIAYVAVLFEATVKVSTPDGPSSTVNPFALSVSASVIPMSVGSLMSII